MTRSPTATFSTPGPTARTMPAHSSPKVGPAKPSISASSGSSPIAHIMSRKLRPAACTSIATSPFPRSRCAIGFQLSASSPPGRSLLSPSRSPGSAQRGGRPRRRRSTCRPVGVQTISVSGVAAPISRSSRSAISVPPSPGGMSTSFSDSRGISLTSVRRKPPKRGADQVGIRTARLLLRAAGHDPQRDAAQCRRSRNPSDARQQLGRAGHRVGLFTDEQNREPGLRLRRFVHLGGGRKSGAI